MQRGAHREIRGARALLLGSGLLGTALFSSVLGAALALAPAAAHATPYFGLQVGDLIDTLGFSVAGGGGIFVDATGTSNDTFDLSATLTEITTTGGSIYTEINGGGGATTKGRADLRLDLVSESLFQFATDTFAYTANFAGRAGANDVELIAPDVSGGDPEQNGALLVAGEIDGNVSIQVVFNSNFSTTPSFTVNGTFEVLSGLGEQPFKDVFGDTGDLADIISTSASTSPVITDLLADGHLFSVRDLDITSDCPVAPSPCTGAYLNDLGDYTFSGTGNISPQSPVAFIPEPSTLLLLTSGLIGLAHRGGRRQS